VIGLLFAGLYPMNQPLRVRCTAAKCKELSPILGRQR
jgi:hypothetical protein